MSTREKYRDLSGKQFNRWTVLYEAPPKRNKNGGLIRYWHCRCICGKEKDIPQNNLKNGQSKSCGCLRDELFAKNNKRYNDYDLSHEYGIGYTDSGVSWIFDKEFYDLLKQYSWHTNGRGYIVAYDKNVHSTEISMHRLIMNAPDDMVVDHINSNCTDNRVANLRIVTMNQNGFNHRINKRNTSGVTGVCWDNAKHKWCATIGFHGKHYYLGRYEKFEDAVAARKAAEEKYFGEYSYDNSQAIAELNKIKG